MSSTQITSLICNNFGGIRRKNSSFSEEQITCSDCQNVELFFTNLNAGVGIRTANGNTSIHSFGDEKIVGLFSSNQGGNRETIFAYTEDTDNGYLYQCDFINRIFTKLDLKINLPATGCACGADFEVGWTYYFVFSNGEKFVYLFTDNNPDPIDPENHISGLQISTTQPVSVDGNIIKGLGLKVFDKKLWVFDKNILYYSFTGNCTDFNTQNQDQESASAGMIPLSKDITAIAEYLGALAVFHKDSSCLVRQDNTTIYAIGDESPGGCASYQSLVFHGTDLYFYDDTKKGVFAFSQVVNGDKILSENIAENIQDELIEINSSNADIIKTICAKSVVTEDRNEVWFIVPISSNANRTIILIYDYIRGEWVKRYSNKINCLLVYEANLYSGGNKIYEEYTSNTFDGEIIEAFYDCSIFNFGTDNTLKITKFPPRLTVNAGETCDFYVEYTRNYDKTRTPKRKRITGKNANNILIYDKDIIYDDKHVYSYPYNAITKLPSTTFKALEMKFSTEEENQGFSIKNIEFSKLKVKQV